MSDQNWQDDRVGQTDHPQHRAGDDEGYRAPHVEETGIAQSSIFDGAGNEIVVVSTTDSEGNRKQGTGKTAEEALADAQDPKQPIGKGFGTKGH